MRNKAKRLDQMAYFFRRSSSKDTVVVRSSRHQDIVQCRKHPKHRQSPGVCSVCLREKLSQLYSSTTTASSSSSSSSSRENNNNNYDFSSSSSSSLSSYYSSSSASACSSPVNARRRFGYYAKGRSINSLSSLTLFRRSKKKKKNNDDSQDDQLSKSRSLIFITRNNKKGVIHGDEMKKKGGLLENFLPGRGMKIKMEENLVHSSKTTTEINVTGF